MGEIEVISTCLVKMANSSPYSPNRDISRMELSATDLSLMLLDQIQRGLIFYKPDFHPSQISEFKETFVDCLKNSLSRALDFFSPLSGRFAKTTNNSNSNTAYNFFVDCNDAGALFTHAIAPMVHVRDILNPIYTPAFVHSLFTLNGVPNSEGFVKPLLGVQVTELVDGLFIGCTMNHVVVDGTSFWHFINSWSEICRGNDTITKFPVFERSFNNNINLSHIPIENPPPELINPIPGGKQNALNMPLLRERVFYFGKENVSKLKLNAQREVGNECRISSLQAILSHVWRAIGRTNSSAVQLVICAFSIGTRTRLPLPDAYFGNAIYVVNFIIENENLRQKGLGWVASELNKIVGMQTQKEAKRVLEGIANNMKMHTNMDIMQQGNNKVLVMGSSPMYGIYETDFGWGKPVGLRSGSAQKYDGMIYVHPGAEPGGMDVEICLIPDAMVALGNDAEFMEFCY